MNSLVKMSCQVASYCDPVETETDEAFGCFSLDFASCSETAATSSSRAFSLSSSATASSPSDSSVFAAGGALGLDFLGSVFLGLGFCALGFCALDLGAA